MLGLGVPYLTHVVHVVLRRVVCLLRFFRQGQWEMRVPFAVVGMMDYLLYFIASSGGSISLSYGPAPLRTE
jgi:hypothetical protein